MYDAIQFPSASSVRQVKATFMACVVFAISSTPLFAQDSDDNTTITGHSTVHIVFIVPNESPATADNAAGPQAVVGQIILPIQTIRPISIAIDGEFVGHALAGFAGIKPVYVLPHGRHEFEFVCDGFKSSRAELTVVGTGSKQYLIVKLEPNAAASPDAESTSKQQQSAKP